MPTKKEIFEASKRAREERKQQEENRGSGGGSYEEIAYTALSPGALKVVRIVGDPLDYPEKSDFSPHTFLRSTIVDDSDSKRMQVNWPMKDDQPNWILWKVYDLVTAYRWNNDENKREFLHQKSHPEIFNKVNKNGKPDNQFERGWKPSLFLALNVIDRHDPDWHSENKHTKVLSKKAREYQDIWFYEPGVPMSLYNMIWDEIVEYSGPWEDYDIVIEKLASNESPWYKVRNLENDTNRIPPDTKKLIVEGPLTAEEKAYEKYDFTRLFKVTRYQKILQRLSTTIQRVDDTFNKNFLEELKDLAAKEKAEEEAERAEEEKENSKKTSTYVPDPELDESPEEETEAAPPEEPKVRKRSRKPVSEETTEIQWDKLADGSFNGTKYLGVPKMTDVERTMVLSVNEDGSFEYVKEFDGTNVELYEFPPDEENAFFAPGNFHVDPLTGEIFE